MRFRFSRSAELFVDLRVLLISVVTIVVLRELDKCY